MTHAWGLSAPASLPALRALAWLLSLDRSLDLDNSITVPVDRMAFVFLLLSAGKGRQDGPSSEQREAGSETARRVWRTTIPCWVVPGETELTRGGSIL